MHTMKIYAMRNERVMDNLFSTISFLLHFVTIKCESERNTESMSEATSNKSRLQSVVHRSNTRLIFNSRSMLSLNLLMNGVSRYGHFVNRFETCQFIFYRQRINVNISVIEIYVQQ